MNYLQRAGAAAYGVALLLVLFPLLDVVQAAWPLDPGEVTWRVVTAGLLSRVLVTPMLGLLLAFAAALLLKQPRILRVLSAVSTLLLAALAIGLPFYALDALQLRSQVTLESRGTFQLGLGISFVKYGVVLLFLALLAWSEWKAATAITRESSRRAAKVPLVGRTARRHGAHPEAEMDAAGAPEPHHG